MMRRVMTNDEMKNRLFALEAFVYSIGSVLYQTLPPHLQDQMDEINDQWNEDRRKAKGEGDEMP
jgi:predicted membrane channel-forming protein YqfA (hemolysin III family)